MRVTHYSTINVMRRILVFVFVPVALALLNVSVYAQSDASPASRLAQFAEGGYPPDGTISKYRTALIGIAARYDLDRSAVADTVIGGGRRLRGAGLSAPVLKILSTEGLGGVDRNDRSFEKMLDLYLKYRIKKNMGHKAAIKKMRPY